MSKKSTKKVRGAATDAPALPVAGGRRRRKYYAASLAALLLLAASAAATRYDAVRRAVGLRPLVVTPAQGNSNLSLSKEYVYAGGRLVATEETAAAATPTPTPAGPPPTNLVATAASASSVSLTWTAPAGSVAGYVVERRGAAGSQPVEISTGGTSTSYSDATPPGDYAYLYRVKAVYAGGTSGYCDADLATTVVFTDSPLQGAIIKADHLTELRRAVNAVRALVPGLGAAAWTYPDPVSSPAALRRGIHLEDVTDLREELDEATGPLGLATGYPANPPLAGGAVVNAQHFEQIRSRVK